jgi:hypothetical protein
MVENKFLPIPQLLIEKIDTILTKLNKQEQSASRETSEISPPPSNSASMPDSAPKIFINNNIAIFDLQKLDI